MDSADSMTVLGAPDIDGLVFRPFRGRSDYPGMVAVRAEAGVYDQVDPLSPRATIPTLDDIARAYAETPTGSPNVLVVEVGGRMIGYNELQWWAEQDGTSVYLHLGWLAPAWRGKGIGTAMLRYAERRLARLRYHRTPIIAIEKVDNRRAFLLYLGDDAVGSPRR